MYVKTIVIDNALLHRIQTGDVKLTPGQWIRLAWLDQRSRFVGVHPRSGNFWGVHTHKQNAFQRCMENFRHQCRRHTAN
jgi:hypothetical protein